LAVGQKNVLFVQPIHFKNFVGRSKNRKKGEKKKLREKKKKEVKDTCLLRSQRVFSLFYVDPILDTATLVQ
jgi:hypothetical protein